MNSLGAGNLGCAGDIRMTEKLVRRNSWGSSSPTSHTQLSPCQGYSRSAMALPL